MPWEQEPGPGQDAQTRGASGEDPPWDSLAVRQGRGCGWEPAKPGAGSPMAFKRARVGRRVAGTGVGYLALSWHAVAAHSGLPGARRGDMLLLSLPTQPVGASANVPEPGGCLSWDGRAAATGFSVAGATAAGMEVKQFPVPKRDVASKNGAGRWVPAPACPGRLAGGQRGHRESQGWQQWKDGLGGQGKCHRKHWSETCTGEAEGREGNSGLWLLLSGQPQAGPAWLSPKSPGLGTGGSQDGNSGARLR